jgi:hypothetical protein
MPRAVRLCRDRGLRPIPAPTEHRTATQEHALLRDLPSAGNLELCQRGFYEGLASARRLLRR